MTIEEAICILKNSAFLSMVSEYQEVEEATKMAIEALEKQIPKKIRVYHDESDTEDMFEDMCACPVCDRDLHGGGDKYCPRCGQKILWGR